MNTAAPSTIPRPLTLEAAIAYARAHHPDLIVADAEIEVIRADSIAARARPFNPELEVAGERGGESFSSGEESAVEVEVSQELELGGKRARRQALAAARLRAAEAQRAVRVQRIELEVLTRFRRVLFLQRRLEVLENLAQLDRQVVASTEARVRDGSVTPLTGRLTQLDGLRVEAQRVKAASEFRQAGLSLAVALGGTLTADLEVAGDLFVDTLGVQEDALVAAAQARRREAELLRRRVMEQEHELQLAMIERRPNLTVGVGLSRERSSFDRGDFSGDPAIVGGISGVSAVDHLLQARVSVPLPIWQRNQGGRVRAAAGILLAQRELERFDYELAIEARIATRAFADAARLYQLYLTRAAAIPDDLTLVRAAYMDARIDLETYLTDKGRLVDTLIDQFDAEDRYWEARAELESRLGVDLATFGLGGTK